MTRSLPRVASPASLYVVFVATFLALMMFFWLELFGDLAAGNMQVRYFTRCVRGC